MSMNDKTLHMRMEVRRLVLSFLRSALSINIILKVLEQIVDEKLYFAC
jgi:hypothetical protein